MLELAIFTVLLLFFFVFYSGYFFVIRNASKKYALSDEDNSTGFSHFASVIVPAYNEEKTIVAKIENLLEQNYSNMEIIIMDDGSSDSTKTVVQKYLKQKNLSLKVVFISMPNRQGKPSVINEAIKHCTGDIVVITDADTLLKKNEIKQFLERFDDPKIGAICGRLMMSNYHNSSSSNIEESYRDVFDVIRLGESVLDSTPVFNGALIALRKGLFTPLKADTLADDTELSFKVRKQGFNTVFDPNTIVYTDTPESFKDRTTQKIRRAQGIIQSFYWHKDMLFSGKFGKFGTFIFPCEFFMHILSPIFAALMTVLLFYIFFTTSALYVILPISLGVIMIVFGLFGMELIFSKTRKNGSDGGSNVIIRIIKLFATFLEHQVFLGVALLFLLFGRVNVKWKRT